MASPDALPAWRNNSRAACPFRNDGRFAEAEALASKTVKSDFPPRSAGIFGFSVWFLQRHSDGVKSLPTRAAYCIKSFVPIQKRKPGVTAPGGATDPNSFDGYFYFRRRPISLAEAFLSLPVSLLGFGRPSDK